MTQKISDSVWLPFGSIDETVRTDGSYAIGYNPKEGTVREVWYSDKYVFQVTDLESEDWPRLHYLQIRERSIMEKPLVL